jgi:ABC-type taurine transport system substrate-binding protein
MKANILALLTAHTGLSKAAANSAADYMATSLGAAFDAAQKDIQHSARLKGGKSPDVLGALNAKGISLGTSPAALQFALLCDAAKVAKAHGVPVTVGMVPGFKVKEEEKK